jgi:hypothetical protein
VEIHTSRIELYLYSIDITKIENQEVRAEEIKLTKDCHADENKIQELITSLNIKEEQATEGIEWLTGMKATIPMHKKLSVQYPEINVKLKSMGIDFFYCIDNSIHILNPNPPVYNPDKNYWEQDVETLKYYISEYNKIDRGVEVDGYYFDGWLYFHFNHFVTNIPTTVVKGGIEENEDKILVPTLRDNEILMTDYFIKSKKEQTMSLIVATRRLAKTTLNSSRIYRAMILSKNQILCAGGSAEDLGHIRNNIDTCRQNINEAFKIHYLSPTDDKRGDVYGIKTKMNKSKETTKLYIINLEGGTKKDKKETLAGFTPDEFILDEFVKFSFSKPLDALKPALWGDGILRCNVLLTGTGGDDALGADAIKMLANPSVNKVTLMDWDALERNVPPEEITWKRKDFGLFLPTQMCIKHRKIKSNLADYLGIESETLKKIPLFVTNWAKARIDEQKERDDVEKQGREKLIKLLAYHPFDPSEIFLSGKASRFIDILDVAKAHRDYLLQTGLWDARKNLFKDSNGVYRTAKSTKELAPFPHKGGTVDAPFLIFEDPPIVKPKFGTYTGGFDDYATDDSDTDSVATFYVVKNEIFGDPFSNKIVASLSFRPEKHKEVWQKWHELMDAYNLDRTAFGENFNYGIKDYLDKFHLADKYLAPSVDFSVAFSIPNNGKRKTGWNPTTSKRFLFDIFVDYCTETFEREREDGTVEIIRGVQRIDDIGLLDEIIGWSENANVDRITAAMGAFAYGHYLRSSYLWKPFNYKNPNLQEETVEKPKERKAYSPYSSSKRRSFYGSGRR